MFRSFVVASVAGMATHRPRSAPRLPAVSTGVAALVVVRLVVLARLHLLRLSLGIPTVSLCQNVASPWQVGVVALGGYPVLRVWCFAVVLLVAFVTQDSFVAFQIYRQRARLRAPDKTC